MLDSWPRARRIAIAVATPLLAFVVLCAWAFSSAPGSSPDDDFHLPSIWCGQGERAGLCEAIDSSPARQVPAPILSSSCYAFRSDLPADCWERGAAGLETIERLNTNGLYPPVFYAAMSMLATPDVAASVIAMRLLNSAFAVAMFTGTFFLLPRRLRPALVISIVGTVVPLGLFVLASTNPSSWALIGAAITWVSLYGATQTTGRRSLGLAAMAVFGAFIGSGARADAGAFAVFGVALVALLASRRRTATLVPVIAAAAIVVIAALSYLWSSQGGAVMDGLDQSRPWLTLGEHLSNFLGVPMLWTGALGGGWGLGWLDTPMPALVWVLSFSVFAGALYAGVMRADWRRATAVGLGLIAMWIVPFVLLAQSRFQVDDQLVQPRYILPLMTMTLGIAALRGGAARRWTGAGFIIAAVSLSLAQAIALFQNIRRYTVGIGAQSLGIDSSAAWWWSPGPSPTAVLGIGAAAFALFLTGLASAFWVRRARGLEESMPEVPRSEASVTVPASIDETEPPQSSRR